MVVESTKIKRKTMGRVVVSVFLRFVLPVTLFAGTVMLFASQVGLTKHP
jgi:hypothetical protein